MNTILDALAMWGLLQVLILCVLARAGGQRERARRRERERRRQACDLVELESLWEVRDASPRATRLPAAPRVITARRASSTTVLGKLR